MFVLVYQTKYQYLVHNKDVCGYAPKDVPISDKLSDTNKDSTDFYNNVKNDKTKSKFEDKFSDQTDLATVLLPRFSKNILLSKFYFKSTGLLIFSFKLLDNISNTLFLYSAFYKSAEKTPKLSIIGIATNDIYCPNETSKVDFKAPPLLCVFDSHHNGEMKTNASIECLPEGHDFYYTTVLIHCPVPFHAQKDHHLHQIKLIQRDSHIHQSKVSKPIEVIRSEHKQNDHQKANLYNNYGLFYTYKFLINCF